MGSPENKSSHEPNDCVSQPLRLTSTLRAQLTDAARQPLSERKLALQVVAQKARVWAAGDNGEACRPWYMLILELYPRGMVINHQIHRPASVAPTSTDLLSFFLQHVVSPPVDEPITRPTHVSFVDSQVTGEVKSHLEKLGIVVDTLTLADGVSDYMRTFADRLVKSDRATRSDAAERPGLLSAPSVTESLVGKLMTSAVRMYDVQPWRLIPEHIALCVSWTPQSEDCLNDTRRVKKSMYVSVLGGDGAVLGFAAVPSLSTLRDKFRRVMANRGKTIADSSDEEGDILDSKHIVPTDICLCAACGAPVASDVTTESGGTGRWAWRCAQCRFVHYCNSDCQRDDWKRRHRAECHRLRDFQNNVSSSDLGEAEEFQNTGIMNIQREVVQARKEWSWIYRELALLFVDPTAVPFDDLDHFDSHRWPLIANTSPPLYPMPFVSIQDSSFSVRRDVPTREELRALTIISNALSQCLHTVSTNRVIHCDDNVSITVVENLAETMSASSP